MYRTERQMLKNSLLKNGDYKTTKEVFERVASCKPNAKLLAELNNKKEIVYYSATEILQTINAIGEGLINIGLEDKHIAIMATNSVKYILCDMAVAGGVGVIVPIDKDASEDLATTLLNKCEADAVIVTSDILKKIERIKPACKKLKTIITIDRKIEGYLFLDDIIIEGEKTEDKKYQNKVLDREKTCEILFTSGTTGANKGVEICQRNLAANIMNCLDVIKGEKTNNTSMSVLPMHHATEINTHIMPRIAAGRLTYINSSMKEMMVNIKIFKPTIITVVPMIANAFYKNIWAMAKKQGKEAKLKKGIKLCNALRKIGIDATHKLFRDLYEPFGGNLKQMVCGGAPLNPEVVGGLKDLGIFIINGFGITECGPLVSMNTDPYTEIYSIGKACPELKVKIADADENGIGELCVKGESVAKGYYKDAAATKQVYDNDGYFHTGDLARMSEDGKLFIAGRKKNLIVLANGKNVFPEELEQEITNSLSYIKDVVVFEGSYKKGDKQEQTICAMFNLDDSVKTISEDILVDDFRKLNKKLPPYKHIGYIEIIDGEFEKNASKKIIRPKAANMHSQTQGKII